MLQLREKGVGKSEEIFDFVTVDFSQIGKGSMSLAVTDRKRTSEETASTNNE